MGKFKRYKFKNMETGVELYIIETTLKKAWQKAHGMLGDAFSSSLSNIELLSEETM